MGAPRPDHVQPSPGVPQGAAGAWELYPRPLHGQLEIGPQRCMLTRTSVWEPNLVSIRSCEDPRQHATEGTERDGKAGNWSVPHCTQGGAPPFH
jgi:hypothetical protein